MGLLALSYKMRTSKEVTSTEVTRVQEIPNPSKNTSIDVDGVDGEQGESEIDFNEDAYVKAHPIYQEFIKDLKEETVVLDEPQVENRIALEDFDERDFEEYKAKEEQVLTEMIASTFLESFFPEMERSLASDLELDTQSPLAQALAEEHGNPVFILDIGSEADLLDLISE